MVDKKATARLAGDVILCNALKIVANSVYGLMAFSRYPSYSPMYSTITGSGRWLLEVLYLVCKFYPHCTWTYGDTEVSTARTRQRAGGAGPEVPTVHVTGGEGRTCAG